MRTRSSAAPSKRSTTRHEVRASRPRDGAHGHPLALHRVAADRRRRSRRSRAPARRARAPGTPSRPCGARTGGASARWAASFLATTSRPDVPLSRRCTMPGRSTPPTPDRSGTWCSSALTSVPPARRRRGGRRVRPACRPRAGARPRARRAAGCPRAAARRAQAGGTSHERACPARTRDDGPRRGRVEARRRPSSISAWSARARAGPAAGARARRRAAGRPRPAATTSAWALVQGQAAAGRSRARLRPAQPRQEHGRAQQQKDGDGLRGRERAAERPRSGSPRKNSRPKRTAE